MSAHGAVVTEPSGPGGPLGPTPRAAVGGPRPISRCPSPRPTARLGSDFDINPDFDHA